MFAYTALTRNGLALSRTSSRSRSLFTTLVAPAQLPLNVARGPHHLGASSSAVSSQGVCHRIASSNRDLRHSFHSAAVSPAAIDSERIHLLSFPRRGNEQPRRRFASSGGFSALPPSEEEAEKQRVSAMTPYEKEMELRKLDADLARLHTLRGINTGELYTFRGKMKALARDYGAGFLVWYWAVWFSTAGMTYAAIELGGVDAMALVTKLDGYTGFDVASKLDPTLGTIALTLAVNEMLEPLRLPVVVLTTKPVVNLFTQR